MAEQSKLYQISVLTAIYHFYINTLMILVLNYGIYVLNT